MLSFFKQSPIGALFGGNLSDGELSGGDLSDGELSGGDLSDGELSGEDLSDGESFGGDLSDGELSGGELSGGAPVVNCPVVNCSVENCPVVNGVQPATDPMLKHDDGDVGLRVLGCRVDILGTNCKKLMLKHGGGEVNWCLMSSDVMRHIRDKLWLMPKHGSINLYVHVNQKAR